MTAIRFRGALCIGLVLACLESSVLLFGQAGTAKAIGPYQTSSLATGPYYALVIGNNNYKYLTKLQTAVNDANAIAQLLREHYGFQTKVLLDASRLQILDAIVEYRRELPENSNLLIYYAGHGHHDRDTDESYWLPVDAQNDSNSNWISADDITRDIRAISSAHVLVISDSCYSGYLAREGDAAIDPKERGAYLSKMLKSKSRTLMSSGGDEPVADAGAPGHSIFAATILESLIGIDAETFSAADLFHRYVQPAVAGRSDQLPQYSVIRNSGHAYGDFIFSRPPGTAAILPITGKPSSTEDLETTKLEASLADPMVKARLEPETAPASSTSGSLPGPSSFEVWHIHGGMSIHLGHGTLQASPGGLSYTETGAHAEAKHDFKAKCSELKEAKVIHSSFSSCAECLRIVVENQTYNFRDVGLGHYPNLGKLNSILNVILESCGRSE